MRRIENWLLSESSFVKDTLYVLLFFLMSTAVFFIFFVLEHKDGFKTLYIGLSEFRVPMLRNIELIVIAASGEEVYFRLIPLVGILLITRNIWVVITVPLPVSLLFGYRHFVDSWMLLALIGMILSVAFLKLGGYKGKYIKSLLLVGLIHGGVNVIIGGIYLGLYDFIISTKP